MLESQTISVAIPCDWQTLYERIWRPEYFPEWASGLSSATMRRDGGSWLASGPAGSVRIRFTDRNALGVMDHWVELGDGQSVYVPLRVIANDEGAEVQLTLFRQPGMTADKFEEDAAWVRGDLDRLRELAAQF
jgi:hypothetical protein